MTSAETVAVFQQLFRPGALFAALGASAFGATAQGQDDCRLGAAEPAIVMNQTGFERLGPKLAILRARAEHPVEWRLTDSSGAVVESGATRPMGFDESAGEAVHQIDFSSFDQTGEGLRIAACGVRSRAFPVGETVYGALAEDSLRYFYLNRLGVDIEPEFAGGDAWARAGGFMNDQATCFSGEDMTGVIWPGCDYSLEVSGGWADAGDYGQYVVNGGIAVWTLQHTFERLEARGQLEALGWTQDRVALPGRQPGVSPILLEARWQIEFMMGLQIPEGARVWVAAPGADAETYTPTEIAGSGLVHHKLHERAWLPLPLLPSQADEPRHLYPPSTAATLNLAAVAAQCARLWRALDRRFAERCLEAAERAFDAAQRHPDLFARNTFDGGGAYGDLNTSDEFYWAATELFLTTRDPRYLAAANRYRAALARHRMVFWGDTELLAELSAYLHPDAGAAFERARPVLLHAAQSYKALLEENGYHYPTPVSDITWGSNAGLLNRALILSAAHDLDPDQSFRDGVVDAIDYVLGRNPLDQSYVAGYGARPMRHPHHRFWAEGADPDFPPAPPGALSGGPNFQVMTDPVAREMEGECAPQRCWVDHVGAYTMNEVAINWNAALFAVAAYLDASPARAGPD